MAILQSDKLIRKTYWSRSPNKITITFFCEEREEIRWCLWSPALLPLIVQYSQELHVGENKRINTSSQTEKQAQPNLLIVQLTLKMDGLTGRQLAQVQQPQQTWQNSFPCHVDMTLK